MKKLTMKKFTMKKRMKKSMKKPMKNLVNNSKKKPMKKNSLKKLIILLEKSIQIMRTKKFLLNKKEKFNF